MVDPVPEDEARDTLGKNLGQGPDRLKDYPSLAARYPVNVSAVTQTTNDPAIDSKVPHVSAIGNRKLANTYTPLTAKQAGDSSLSDLHIQKGARPLAPDIANQIVRILHRRFDPRFIEFSIQDEQFISDAIALVRGGDGREPLFQQYTEEIKCRNENDSTPALTAALNEIGNVLLRQRLKPKSRAKKPLPFFYTGCRKPPQRNPDLRFLPGHGEGQVNKDGKRPISAWNGVEPDILVWKDPNLLGGINWKEIASLFEAKQDASADMRERGERVFHKSFPQILKYLVSLTSVK